MKLYTIGHSNRTLKEFIEILHSYHISHLIDIRTIPRSRHVPWFNSMVLMNALAKQKIGYTHLASLGGLRHAHKNSINTGWRNASFKGFADYMQTKEFFAGLKLLHEYMRNKKNVVIMCAEAVPWRCHRSLIADAEIIRKIAVEHILSATSSKKHELTDFAVVDKTKKPFQICYPK